jgi:SAM-dependent methyltransferase
MFEEHKLKWTPEKIARFWKHKFKRGNQFNEQASKKLLKIVFRHIKPKSVLDYGCGTGGLIAALLERGVWAYGTDMDDLVTQRFKNETNFCGFTIPPNCDAIFITEVIEHIEDLKLVFDSFPKFKYLVATVPYNEDLKSYETICPDCGAVFNNRQHVESYDEKKIIRRMENYGLAKIFCKAVNLSDTPLRGAVKRIYRFLFRVPHDHPHLIYIGKK